MYFALFENDGLPKAFFNSSIHADTIPDDAIKISTQQWRAFIDHPGKRKWLDGRVVACELDGPSAEAIASAALRSERDRLFEVTRPLVERHAEELALGRPTTLSEDRHFALLNYRQALRDLPDNTADPANVVWPMLPA